MKKNKMIENIASSLNPCFNGRWSRRFTIMLKNKDVKVLILVLMEDGLGVH